MHLNPKQVLTNAMATLLIVTMVLSLGACRANESEELVYDDPQAVLWDAIDSDDTDYDNDEIPNEEEKELGTNLFSPDTDEDGLGDYYEVYESHTNPKQKDTDDDGLNDYVEIKAGLNPNEKMSDGKTRDNERMFEERYTHETVSVEVEGDANIYGTYCNTFSVTGLSKTPGVMSQAYEIYHKDKLDAKLSFKYDTNYIQSRGGDVENLTICSFTADGKFKPLQNCKIDDVERTVSATIKESGKYLLCDSEVVKTNHKTKIMILIDNSGSMYPESMCEGSIESDINFYRLDMANNIISYLDDSVEFGLGKFTGGYTTMAPIGTDEETLKQQIDGIEGAEENFNGTFIATSIVTSLRNFTEEHNNDRKFIIMLTDGETTESWFNSPYDQYDAIKECNDKNVAVITIGLGNSVDEDYLKLISNQTGGTYIYANNASALQEVHNAIIKQLVYSVDDVDEDGTSDSYVVADTGFNMQNNAFSFENFAAITYDPDSQGQLNGGVCYGMALLAQAAYRNIDIFSGSSYEKRGYTFPNWNITDIMQKADNLRNVESSILNKSTAIFHIESKDRYVLQDGVLRIKPDILKKYSDEYLAIKEQASPGVWGSEKYTSYEAIYIDIDKYCAQDKKRDDMEVACALYCLWGIQFQQQSGWSLKSYDLHTGWAGSSNESDYQTIVDKLSAGIPMVISYNINANSAHAVNATRILRDIDSPTTYYLEYYDNNDNTNPCYFKIEHGDMGFWNGTSISNWGKNYSVRPYQKVNGKWEGVSLEFEEIVK